MKEYFYYDESSPSFLRWKVDRGTKTKIGDTAGSIDQSSGYFRVNFRKKNYRVHILVYLLFNERSHGQNTIVDHIDGNRANNAISNLREIPAEQNKRNTKKYVTNVSGVTGVSEYHYFIASWNENGKTNHKKFYVSEYKTQEKALQACVSFRVLKIQELNEKGSGYTERHGT